MTTNVILTLYGTHYVLTINVFFKKNVGYMYIFGTHAYQK